jgi:N-acetylglucosaminyl-diphospho-decaprenol L-rhamnosyltransferase
VASRSGVSVVVVAHDSGTWLDACVRSVLAQSAPELELIVVDNASRDGAIERLPSDPRVLALRNPDNRGFGTACNQGAARARGVWLLFLNPDCELPPSALSQLVACANQMASLGLLGAQLLNDDGSPQAASRRRAPTPQRLWQALRQGRAAIEVPSSSTAEIEEVEAVSGALMFLPRDLFEAVGGFDPGYVLHFEDLDLCRRVRDAGRRVAIANDVRVVHHKGTSSRKRPLWVEWQKHRGLVRYFRKFDASSSPRWLRLALPLVMWLRFPAAALRAWIRARQR